MSVRPQLLSGTRGKISIKDANGTVRTLALIVDVDVSVRASVRETFVMGSENAVSLDPVGIEVDCSVGRVVPVNLPGAELNGNKDGLAGDTAKTSAIALGLEQTIQTMLVSNTIEITLTDKITDRVIASVKEARFAGRSISTGAEGVASERLNFVGIYDSGNGGTENVTTTGYGL